MYADDQRRQVRSEKSCLVDDWKLDKKQNV